MASLIVCPHCGRKNRIGPSADGTPRCGNCHQPLPWVVDADQQSFEAEVHAAVPVVLDLWATWCGPCRMVSPVLEQIAADHAGELKVVKVDVDANPHLAQRYDALSIPLLVVLRDGEEVDRVVGALPRRELERRLAPVLAPTG